jgi:apolipoprotein D and lipocalin family protein
MKKLILILTMILSTTTFASTIATGDIIDVQRYTGKWYAISALPLFFSKGCTSQTAEYGALSDTKISVLNTCYKPGKKKWIKGEAEITNFDTNSELVVRFYTWWARAFRVKGDYNIIKIDPNYDYVMVGGNDRKSLWIMSRTKTMPEEVYNEYIARAEELHFNTNRLIISKF